MIPQIENQAKIKSKLFQENEKILPPPNLSRSLTSDSVLQDIIIVCLPMPPHVPFFISGDIGKFLGYEQEEVIGNTNFWVNTVHIADVPQLFTGFYHMFIRGYHVYDYHFLRKDGTYTRMLVQLFLHHPQKGKPATVMAILQEPVVDIAAPPLAKGNDFNKKGSIEMTVDSKNRIRSISPAMEELIGYSPKKIINKSPLDFIPPDYVFALLEAHAKIINQKHDFLRFWNAVVHQDGSLRFLMHECTGYNDDRGERMIKFRCKNITDQVSLDEKARARCEKKLLSSLSGMGSNEYQSMGAHSLEKLRGREREILFLTVEGFSSTQIGIRLSISSRTVEAHRANLMRKLNANSINQLVRYMVLNIFSSGVIA